MKDEQDFTDPAYVLGAVLAQLEDLDDERAAAVLAEARATRSSPEPPPDDVVAEMRAWQPDELQFVIVSQPHWERIQNAVEGAGIGAQLDGITVMPVELDAEES